MPIVQPTGADPVWVFGSGWSADLSTMPDILDLGAGITGDTPNASLAEYAFYQKFDLAGTPIWDRSRLPSTTWHKSM